MLIGALACCIAWGIIDGNLYLMGCLSEHGRDIRSLRALRKAAAPEQARRVCESSHRRANLLRRSPFKEF
jgi:hypothetical protein